MAENENEVRFTRQQLYEQVWERPASHIARDVGLTPQAITEACREYDIPRPSSGYWTQRDFGKAVPRAPLPPRPEGEVVVLRPIGRRAMSPGKPAGKSSTDPTEDAGTSGGLVTAEPDAATDAIKQAGQEIVEPTPDEELIAVPEVLTRPHRLVAQAGKCLRGAKEDHKGYLVPKEKPCLDVRVTRSSLNRALRIMNALIKAVEKRGWLVELIEGQNAKTQVTVNGETLEIWVEEKVSRREKPLSPAEQRKKDTSPYYYHSREYFYVPTGELALRLDGSLGWGGSRRTWADGKRQTVEGRLARFIAGLAEAAVVVREWREQREREAREREERRRKAQELATLKREETARLEQLDKEVAGWHKAQRIREYVDAVQKSSRGRECSPEQEAEFTKWVQWALQQADRADPLRESPPSVLDEPDISSYW